MLEPPVRAVLDARGGTATVVDVAGNEGYFAHQLLRWGAGRATCIDIRDVHVRRATLVREHFGVPADRLVVESGDVFALDHDRLGSFDVVLVLGLIYHVENPMGALRRARRLTAPGGVCIVESQLTEQREPIRYGGGLTDYFLDAEASFAAIFEAEQDSNPLASSGGVLSLVPNAAAFELMMRTAGFADVEWLSARPDLNPQYVHRHRGMLAGRVD